MQVRFRTVFWSAAAVVVVAGLAFTFRPQPIPVDTTQVTRDRMLVSIRDEGRTRLRNEYVVSAPVSGRLLRVLKKPGDTVEVRETIARIVPGDPAFLDARAQAEARAAIRSAESALAAARSEQSRAEAQATFARSEAQRIETLQARGLASDDALQRVLRDLQVAEAALRATRDSVGVRQAELEAAGARLIQPGAEDGAGSIVEVTAPVSGRILVVAQESEGVVTLGTEIMTLGDPNDLEVVVELLSTQAVQVQPGARVFIENWGGDTRLEGRVRLVEPFGFLKISALGVEEQRVNVIVDFLAPIEAGAVLGHGYRIEAAIVTWEAEDVVQVPVAALFRNSGAWAVFRVQDGAARLTPVEVGRDNGQMAQVLTGVQDGDTLVLYPSETIEDGSRVVARARE